MANFEHMAFLRKAGFIIFLVIAFAAGTWGYFQLKKSKRPVREAVSLLPAGAALYAESGSFGDLYRSFASRSMAVDQLRELPAISALSAGLRQLDSLAQESEGLRRQLEASPLHFALYGIDQWLLCFSLSTVSDERELAAELEPLLHQRTVDGISMFEWKTVGQTFYFVMQDGIVALSGSREIITRALEEEDRLLSSPGYLWFREQLPMHKPLLLYVDHQRYQAAGFNEHLDLSGLSAAGYSCGDFEAGTTGITLNGFLKGRSHGTALFKGDATFATRSLIEALPGGCTDFRALAFDSAGSDDEKGQSPLFWKSAADTALYDVRRAFYKNMAGCIAEYSTGEQERAVLVFVKDSLSAREHLQAMSDSVVHGNLTLFRLRSPEKLFSSWLEEEFLWAAVKDAQLYFCRSGDLLRQSLTRLQAGVSMGAHEGFSDYCGENMTESFSEMLYAVPRRSITKARKILGSDSLLCTRVFSGFRHFSMGLSGQETPRLRVHLQLGPEEEEALEKEEVRPLWTIDLGEPVTGRPQLFTNHLNGENEIVVQDRTNTLFLVNAKGEVLWKRPLPAQMMSPLFVVDAFRNNKFQMLFNTRDAIYLLDRNGKDVEGFPVRLSAPATAPLSVFDYENNRTYRLVVPCANKVISNYGIDGKPQPTWESPRTGAIVRMPLQYANVGGKEYLVAIDEEGGISLLNRRGQTRVRLKNRALAGCRSFYADDGSQPGDSYIIYVDEKNGLLHRISFTDKKEIREIGMSDTSFFAHADHNRFMDVVTISGTRCRAFDLAANSIHTVDFPEKVTSATYHGRDDFLVVYGYSQPAQKVFVQSGQRRSEFTTSVDPLLCDLFRRKHLYFVGTEGTSLFCRPAGR
jgi:hypothetical protein